MVNVCFAAHAGNGAGGCQRRSCREPGEFAVELSRKSGVNNPSANPSEANPGLAMAVAGTATPDCAAATDAPRPAAF